MSQNSKRKSILFLFICTIIVHSQIYVIPKDIKTQELGSINQPVYFTIVKNVTAFQKPHQILSQLAVPGFSRKHGYNYIAFDGWSCNSDHGIVIQVWKNINKYINDSIASDSKITRAVLKQFFRNMGVKLLVNAFGSYQKPVSQGIDPIVCSNQLQKFIEQYGFDGANIDFKDNQSFSTNLAISWLTKFTININSSQKLIFSHTIDVELFSGVKRFIGDYSLVQKAVGQRIKFYNVRYSSTQYNSFNDIFMTGALSVQNLNKKKKIPLNKIIVGKPSIENQEGFIPPHNLLMYARKALRYLNWRSGIMFETYIAQIAIDQTRFLTQRRDQIDTIKAVNMDTILKWWPPEATASDIGVPGFAPNNMYNYLIFGTYTCSHGAYDIAKLWSQADFFLSKTFGKDKQEIQSFLKDKYNKKKKFILVRAFGNAQSPTTAGIKPQICAKHLSQFILDNNLDGTDINYRDNVAFNNNLAQNWLTSFIATLRKLLPFHTISTTIQAYHLNTNRYPSGSFKQVISNVGDQLDFYNIVYHGQLNSNFNNYQQIFLKSHQDNYQTSVKQLVDSGFELNKIIVSKPLSKHQLVDGFVEPFILREMFLKASKQLQWKGGICYTNFINDKIGQSLSLLIRGINKTEPIKFTYINNVKNWWPPTATLAQMGTPSLAKANKYNYVAYSFWTCEQGPLAISKLYDDPLKFFGNQLGQTKQIVQNYISKLHKEGNVNLMVSAFGATQQPVKRSLDPIKCADSFITYVNNNQLNGVDIDYQDSQSLINGTGVAWLTIFMRQLRNKLPFHIVSHAPQGPYFSPFFSPTGAYLQVDEKVGHYIDFYNIQFYNQVGTTYDSYQLLFVDSGPITPNTSIFQLIQLGIEPQKIVLGKPVSQKDVYNTGLVQASSLNKWICMAVADNKNPGWKPAVMTWNYLSDLQSEFISQVMKRC